MKTLKFLGGYEVGKSTGCSGCGGGKAKITPPRVTVEQEIQYPSDKGELTGIVTHKFAIGDIGTFTDYEADYLLSLKDFISGEYRSRFKEVE